MYFADSHTHTQFSFDSTADIDEMCQRAIALGLHELTLTDHMDFWVYEGKGEFDPKERQDAIFALKEKYADKILIRNGVEIGQPQENMEKYKKFQKFEFDFIIGSIHNLPNDVDVAHFDYEVVDAADVYRQYMQAQMKLATEFDFDVMGHITLPQRYLYRSVKRKLDLTQFEGLYKELFEVLIAKGKGIEVNTSGLRQGIEETMPSAQVLKWYKECGGKIITVGSDAHNTKDLFCGVLYSYRMLQELGFDTFMTYENRQYIAHKL